MLLMTAMTVSNTQAPHIKKEELSSKTQGDVDGSSSIMMTHHSIKKEEEVHLKATASESSPYKKLARPSAHECLRVCQLLADLHGQPQR